MALFVCLVLSPGRITGGGAGGHNDIVCGEGPRLPGWLFNLSNPPAAAGSRYKKPCLAWIHRLLLLSSLYVKSP